MILDIGRCRRGDPGSSGFINTTVFSDRSTCLPRGWEGAGRLCDCGVSCRMEHGLGLPSPSSGAQCGGHHASWPLPAFLTPCHPSSHAQPWARTQARGRCCVLGRIPEKIIILVNVLEAHQGLLLEDKPGCRLHSR